MATGLFVVKYFLRRESPNGDIMDDMRLNISHLQTYLLFVSFLLLY